MVKCPKCGRVDGSILVTDLVPAELTMSMSTGEISTIALIKVGAGVNIKNFSKAECMDCAFKGVLSDFELGGPDGCL